MQWLDELVVYLFWAGSDVALLCNFHITHAPAAE